MKTVQVISHKDSLGNVIKEEDVIMVVTRSSRFFMQASFDRKAHKWIFYNRKVLGFTWEDLRLPQVLHIEVVPQCGQKGLE